MVCLVNLLQRQDCLSNIDVEEGLVHDALFEVCDGSEVVEQSLFALVMSGDDKLVFVVPLFGQDVVEEAAVLDDEHLFLLLLLFLTTTKDTRIVVVAITYHIVVSLNHCQLV